MINVMNYGAAGNGTTDDSTAIEKAIDAAGVGGTVFFPKGKYKVTRTIDFGHPTVTIASTGLPSRGRLVNFVGEDESNTYIESTVLGAAFKITAGITSTVLPDVVNYHSRGLSFNFVGTANVSGSRPSRTHACAIEIAGPDSTNTDWQTPQNDNNFFQWSSFRNMTFSGFFAGIMVTKGTRPTWFGKENQYNWSTHADLTFHDYGNHKMLYGIWFRKGSGTGNNFINLKGSMGASDTANESAIIRYGDDGPNSNYTRYVVGDVLTGNSHISAGTKTFISMGHNCDYMGNINVSGNQFDASLVYPIRVDDAAYLSLMSLRGSNKGGNTQFSAGIPGMVRTSVIDDLGASEWLAGNDKKSTITGLQTMDLFEFEIGQWDCTSVTLVIGGIIGYVGTAILKQDFLIHQTANGNSPTVAAGPQFYVNAAGSTTGGSTFTLNTTVSANKVKFSVTFTSGGDTQLDAQIRATGGGFKIKRLVV